VALSDAPAKIGAVVWIPVPKRIRERSANDAQGATVDQDRIVGRARLAAHGKGH
jgi:hypothetical protein